MSRFYLHIRSKDGGMSYDNLGLDYPDVETAWSAVVRAAKTSNMCSQPEATIRGTMPLRLRMIPAR